MIYATKRIGWCGQGGVWCFVEADGRYYWVFSLSMDGFDQATSPNLVDAVAWLHSYCNKDYWDAFVAASESEQWAKRVIRDQDIVLRGVPGSGCTTGVDGR